MRQSVIAPSSIIVQVENKQQDFANFQFNVDKKSFASSSDYIYYLTHHVNNTKHKNGRVYYSMENGVLCANSVSPYAEQFWHNVEEKIKPIVEVLHGKRYLTYSSCQGHGMDFRRYVGLAFCDEETRSYVATYIKKMNIKGVSLRLYNSVSNNVVEEHDITGKPIPTKTKDSVLSNDKESEVTSFNIQFHRNYEDYFFMEIVIFDEISYDYQGIFKELKKIYQRIIKRNNLEKSTQKLLVHLRQIDFKTYKY